MAKPDMPDCVILAINPQGRHCESEPVNVVKALSMADMWAGRAMRYRVNIYLKHRKAL